MKSFFVIIITFVLMSVSALAVDPPPVPGTGSGDAEFGAFFVCQPSLSMVDDKYIEPLGKFFVNGVDRSYVITPAGEDWLGWELKGPVLDGDDNPILYNVKTGSPQNSDDGLVVLEIHWKVVAANKSGSAEYGYLDMQGSNGVELVDPNPLLNNCDGIATFTIIALKLHVDKDALPGPRTFQVTVSADASI
jgi:hypothetical protein